jgi:hypothetical protein
MRPRRASRGLAGRGSAPLLLGALLVALLVTAYGLRQRSLAVVSVHYSAAAEAPIEDLYVFAGTHKRWTPVLAPGGRVREAFTADTSGPLVVLTRIGSAEYDWQSEPVRPGERVLLRLDASGVVSASRCRWPCP